MMELNDGVGWHPESAGEGRFGDWLRGNVDWALSRERYWGTPLPLWVCPEGHVRCLGSRAELEALAGEQVTGLHRSDVDHLTFACHCGAQMRRTPEVLDVWWDSGAMPFAQHHYPFEGQEEFAEQAAADFVCEGLDQTRGWFYSLLAVSALVFDRVPYKNVLCLGLVADEEGKKMSKSRGNAVDPVALFSEVGSDAVRWYYLCAKQPWEGYNFSRTELGDASGDLSTLWHVSSFCKTYAESAGVRLGSSLPQAVLPLDRWLLARLQTVTGAMSSALEGYDATTAARELQGLVEDLSNWYLRLSRRRLWAGDEDAFATLSHVLRQVARLAAPLVPFVAEHLWNEMGGGDSVHLTAYPQVDEAFSDPALEEAMEVVRDLTSLARMSRSKAKLPLRQPLLQATFLLARDEECRLVEEMMGVLSHELNVKSLVAELTPESVARVFVKPDYRLLGPRFQERMPQLRTVLESLDAATLVKALEDEGQVSVNLDGEVEVLSASELHVALEALPGFGLEVSGARAVALVTDLTPQLEEEGLVREVLHELQMLRRQMGLDVSDRVRVLLSCDPATAKAVSVHKDYLCQELLALSLDMEEESQAETLEVRGHKVSVTLELASSTAP